MAVAAIHACFVVWVLSGPRILPASTLARYVTVGLFLGGILAVLARSTLGLAVAFDGWALLVAVDFVATPSGLSGLLAVVAGVLAPASTATYHGVLPGAD